MATAEEKRKAIAAARSMVRRMEIRAELDAWLAKASTRPRIRYKTHINSNIQLRDNARIIRR